MIDKTIFFIYVVQLGSISAAARRYGISPSAGSRWLSDLETEFGLKLYRRNNRLLTLTEAGERLYQRFKLINQDIQSSFDEVKGYQSEEQGKLHIACTPLYASHYLMGIINRYLQDHPKVSFNLNITPWSLDLASHTDLVISANANFSGYKEKDLMLVKRELMSAPFKVCASPDYLATHGKPEIPQDLKQHRCLFATSLTGSNEWVFCQQEENLIIKVPDTLEVNDSDLLKQAVLAGSGIAYLPDFILEKEMASGQLEALLPEYGTSKWSLNAYYQPHNSISPLAAHFKDFLLAQHNK